MRAETLVAHPNGLPFYCGKTVGRLSERLYDHKYGAAKFPRRPVSARVLECGEAVRIHCIDVVPVKGDWIAAEQSWIEFTKARFPGCVNVAKGGEGVPGMIVSEATRERLRDAGTGRKQSAETVAKRITKTKGMKRSPETLARLSAARKGRVVSLEQRAKISATLKGRSPPSAQLAAMHAGNRGRKLSDEHRAAISAGKMGVLATVEHRAKISAAKLGRKLSPANYARVAVMHIGRKRSAETKARMSAAQKGRVVSPEARKNLREAWVRRKANQTLTVSI